MRPQLKLFGLLGNVARSTVFPEDLADSKRRFALIYFVRLMFLVGRRLWIDHCPRQAAALAYQTFLSMVPLLVVSLAVASTFELDGYLSNVTTYLEAHLLPEAAADAGRYIVDIVNAIRPQTLGFVGGGGLVILGMTLLFTVEQVVNEIFRQIRPLTLWKRVISAFVLLILAPPAFGLSVYFTIKMAFLPQFLTAMIPLLFTVFGLFLSYWLLPHTKIKIRYSIISAVVAGAFFEIVKLLFALYVRHLGATLSYIYGTLAILPMFMVWTYLAWLIFLFGAELNAALHEVKRHNQFEKIEEIRDNNGQRTRG